MYRRGNIVNDIEKKIWEVIADQASFGIITLHGKPGRAYMYINASLIRTGLIRVNPDIRVVNGKTGYKYEPCNFISGYGYVRLSIWYDNGFGYKLWDMKE